MEARLIDYTSPSNRRSGASHNTKLFHKEAIIRRLPHHPGTRLRHWLHGRGFGFEFKPPRLPGLDVDGRQHGEASQGCLGRRADILVHLGIHQDFDPIHVFEVWYV